MNTLEQSLKEYTEAVKQWVAVANRVIDRLEGPSIEDWREAARLKETFERRND